MRKVDLAKTPLARTESGICTARSAGTNEPEWEIINPMGFHAVAVGVDAPINIDVRGSVGYYCAGMNKQATITVHGSAGPGVAENMMSGSVGSKATPASTPAPRAAADCFSSKATPSSRCGISMKGIDIVVKGNIGHMSAFMAQSGHLVVLGDAGDALGDSIYEAKLFVRGKVKSLGADCIEKEMRPEHHDALKKLARSRRELPTSNPASSSAMALRASSTTSTSTTRMLTDVIS